MVQENSFPNMSPLNVRIETCTKPVSMQPSSHKTMQNFMSCIWKVCTYCSVHCIKYKLCAWNTVQFGNFKHPLYFEVINLWFAVINQMRIFHFVYCWSLNKMSKYQISIIWTWWWYQMDIISWKFWLGRNICTYTQAKFGLDFWTPSWLQL